KSRQDRGAITGNSDLSTVGVPRELKIDGMTGHLVREIGFMYRDDRCLRWRNSLKRFVQVVGSFINVVHTHDPDSLAISFQRHRLIAQDRKTMAIEDLRNQIRTVPVVVVAQDGHDRSSF